MRLQQGQLWKQGDDYFRIVEWARLSIVYKAMKDPASETKEGTRHKVTKKEFCRLIKGAELIEPKPPARSHSERGTSEESGER